MFEILHNKNSKYVLEYFKTKIYFKYYITYNIYIHIYYTTHRIFINFYKKSL